MDNLYPAQPDLNRMVPRILVEPERGIVDPEDPAVAEGWEKMFEHMEERKRQYIGIFWLAHTGRMLDKEDRIWFDLTTPEAAAYMALATGVDRHQPDLAGPTIEELLDMELLRFNQIRECRQRETDKQAYRLQREILNPVTEMR